jgi:hypothetical protein
MSAQMDDVLESGRQGAITFSQFVDGLSAFPTQELASAMTIALDRGEWGTLQALVLAGMKNPGRDMTQPLCAILLRNSQEMTSDDVVDLLHDLADPRSIEALRRAADLEQPGDDIAHHFNRKCALALEHIGTDEAYQALAGLERKGIYESIRDLAGSLVRSRR